MEPPHSIIPRYLQQSIGNSVLQEGILEGNVDKVRTGLTNYADDHIKFNETIGEAVLKGNNEIVKLLYEADASVPFNYKNPLLAACDMRNIELINYFFDKGLREKNLDELEKLLEFISKHLHETNASTEIQDLFNRRKREYYSNAFIKECGKSV